MYNTVTVTKDMSNNKAHQMLSAFLSYNLITLRGLDYHDSPINFIGHSTTDKLKATIAYSYKEDALNCVTIIIKVDNSYDDIIRYEKYMNGCVVSQIEITTDFDEILVSEAVKLFQK